MQHAMAYSSYSTFKVSSPFFPLHNNQHGHRNPMSRFSLLIFHFSLCSFPPDDPQWCVWRAKSWLSCVMAARNMKWSSQPRRLEFFARLHIFQYENSSSCQPYPRMEDSERKVPTIIIRLSLHWSPLSLSLCVGENSSRIVKNSIRIRTRREEKTLSDPNHWTATVKGIGKHKLDFHFYIFSLHFASAIID